MIKILLGDDESIIFPKNFIPEFLKVQLDHNKQAHRNTLYEIESLCYNLVQGPGTCLTKIQTTGQ